jgi:hypothetical protein
MDTSSHNFYRVQLRSRLLHRIPAQARTSTWAREKEVQKGLPKGGLQSAASSWEKLWATYLRCGSYTYWVHGTQDCDPILRRVHSSMSTIHSSHTFDRLPRASSSWMLQTADRLSAIPSVPPSPWPMSRCGLARGSYIILCYVVVRDRNCGKMCPSNVQAFGRFP